MIDYTLIKARPTRYRGIMFRSRLEATWAAFFDQLQWPWEYEPFELNGWVPDFLISGKHKSLLVEIKPVDFTDQDVEAKVAHAAQGYDCYLMIGGRQPMFESEILVFVNTMCRCGGNEAARRCEGWSPRALVGLPDGGFDIVFEHGPYPMFRSGFEVGKKRIDEYMGREVWDLWARAKNATQWRPPSWRA
jgi:hypothetical protein